MGYIEVEPTLAAGSAGRYDTTYRGPNEALTMTVNTVPTSSRQSSPMTSSFEWLDEM
jgi:hypothetical protein